MAEIVQEESEAPKKDTTKENAKYNFTTSKNEWLLLNF
jgi:hypothetical protein